MLPVVGNLVETLRTWTVGYLVFIDLTVVMVARVGQLHSEKSIVAELAEMQPALTLE